MIKLYKDFVDRWKYMIFQGFIFFSDLNNFYAIKYQF